MKSVESHLKEQAANSEYRLAELKKTKRKIEELLQNNLNEYFERFRLQRGENKWLFRDVDDSVWLALSLDDLVHEMRKADRNYNKDKLYLVAYSFLERFQSRDLTLAVPGTVARRVNDKMFYPIAVPYPEGWKESEYHTYQMFEELVMRYEMTPAEALDHWVIDNTDQTAREWARCRGVEAESVRKNVRQASEKRQDDSLGATNENANFSAVNIEEVPEDGVYDSEKDVYYVPSEDQATEIRERSTE